MSLGARFKFWQPVAMDWVREKRADGLGGMLLCDAIGLGKMREAIGYLLTVSCAEIACPSSHY